MATNITTLQNRIHHILYTSVFALAPPLSFRCTQKGVDKIVDLTIRHVGCFNRCSGSVNCFRKPCVGLVALIIPKHMTMQISDKPHERLRRQAFVTLKRVLPTESHNRACKIS